VVAPACISLLEVADVEAMPVACTQPEDDTRVAWWESSGSHVAAVGTPEGSMVPRGGRISDVLWPGGCQATRGGDWTASLWFLGSKTIEGVVRLRALDL
jgi:hypothetical protein